MLKSADYCQLQLLCFGRTTIIGKILNFIFLLEKTVRHCGSLLHPLFKNMNIWTSHWPIRLLIFCANNKWNHSKICLFFIVLLYPWPWQEGSSELGSVLPSFHFRIYSLVFLKPKAPIKKCRWGSRVFWIFFFWKMGKMGQK